MKYKVTHLHVRTKHCKHEEQVIVLETSHPEYANIETKLFLYTEHGHIFYSTFFSRDIFCDNYHFLKYLWKII